MSLFKRTLSWSSSASSNAGSANKCQSNRATIPRVVQRGHFTVTCFQSTRISLTRSRSHASHPLFPGSLCWLQNSQESIHRSPAMGLLGSEAMGPIIPQDRGWKRQKLWKETKCPSGTEQFSISKTLQQISPYRCPMGLLVLCWSKIHWGPFNLC